LKDDISSAGEGMSERWILHVDLDAFYASVEELLNPALRGKPVIVGGDPDRRGVVASCSYAARVFGVRSAMPMSRAVRLCPQAVIVHGHYREYSKYSRMVMDILWQITPQIEQISIDEAFMDVSGCEKLWGSVEQIAQMIQHRVTNETNLPVSLGAAACKLVAKIACEFGKPNGLVVVAPGTEANFLAPLPIERLWGVGKATAARLQALGIHKIGDLAAYPTVSLTRVLGQHSAALQNQARGLDPSPVNVNHDRRSVSQERTFDKDVGDKNRLLRVLLQLCEQVAWRMRTEGFVGQTVHIKVRYPDFTTFTRQVTLKQPTDQGQVIYQEATRLLDENWQTSLPLRLLGVGVSGLVEHGGYQLNLFEHKDLRQSKLNVTIDIIRERFGDSAIQRASLLEHPSKLDHRDGH
jgi:DNA polymerase IV